MHVSVVRRYSFEAAHVLPWHPGKCRNLHGHSYSLLVTVTGAMDDRGVVAEFGDLDDVIETNLLLGDDGLDHADLNTVIDNPTVERLAVHIGERLSSLSLNWTRVELWETSRGAAIVER